MHPGEQEATPLDFGELILSIIRSIGESSEEGQEERRREEVWEPCPICNDAWLREKPIEKRPSRVYRDPFALCMSHHLEILLLAKKSGLF